MHRNSQFTPQFLWRLTKPDIARAVKTKQNSLTDVAMRHCLTKVTCSLCSPWRPQDISLGLLSAHLTKEYVAACCQSCVNGSWVRSHDIKNPLLAAPNVFVLPDSRPVEPKAMFVFASAYPQSSDRGRAQYSNRTHREGNAMYHWGDDE